MTVIESPTISLFSSYRCFACDTGGRRRCLLNEHDSSTDHVYVDDPEQTFDSGTWEVEFYAEPWSAGVTRVDEVMAKINMEKWEVSMSKRADQDDGWLVTMRGGAIKKSAAERALARA